MYFEQRLRKAQETRAISASASKERTENKNAFHKEQLSKKNKVKTDRQYTLRAKETLSSKKAQAAAALREKKAQLAEMNKQQMQERYTARQRLVTEVALGKVWNEEGALLLNSPSKPTPGKPASATATGMGGDY